MGRWSQRIRLALVFSCLSCLSLLACTSSDKKTQKAPAGRSVVLSMTASGALALKDADTELELFALSTSGPRISTFEQNVSGVGALTFSHTNESKQTLKPGQLQIIDGGRQASWQFIGEQGASASLKATVVDEHVTQFELTVSAEGVNSVAIAIRCDADGTFHGWGEQYNAVDQRGEAFDLVVNEQGNGRTGDGGISVGDKHTTYFPMPWYLDARGWGVLFATERRVRVDLCQSQADVAWVEVVGDTVINWRVFHGPEPLDVIEQLGAQVGRPQSPPKWAWWLWIGTQGGKDKVLAEADALEAAGIPTAALWAQDWGGIRKNLDGGFGVEYVWKPDESLVSDPSAALYPGFTAMVDGLHERGYKFLVYANPFIPKQVQSSRFDEMAERGLLIKDKSGDVYEDTLVPNLPQTDGHPDFGHPETVDYIAAQLGAIVRDHHVDGWMLDFGEWVPTDGVHHDGSDPVSRRNTFPVDWNRSCRKAASEQRPDNDFAWIARSGWSGVQKHAQIHWVGDQETNWDGLDGFPTVVPALLTLGLSGQPFVTHDIAGFAKGQPSDKELWMRWTELGAFTPVMRTHEGADKLANWSWEKDEETTTHFRKFTYVHCALRPLWSKLANQAASTSAPLLRAMFLEFPSDKNTWPLYDQFMIGSKLLVAPVLKQGAVTRSLYLPAGSWYDVWNGKAYAGGRWVEVDAPLGRPAVFSQGKDFDAIRKAESNLKYSDCRPESASSQ